MTWQGLVTPVAVGLLVLGLALGSPHALVPFCAGLAVGLGLALRWSWPTQ